MEKLNKDLIGEIVIYLDEKDRSRLRCVSKILSVSIPKISKEEQQEYFYHKVRKNTEIISKLASETLNVFPEKIIVDYLIEHWKENIISYSQLLKLLYEYRYFGNYNYTDRIYTIINNTDGVNRDCLSELCSYAFDICSGVQLINFYNDIRHMIVIIEKDIAKESRDKIKEYLMNNIKELIDDNSEYIYERIYFCLDM